MASPTLYHTTVESKSMEPRRLTADEMDLALREFNEDLNMSIKNAQEHGIHLLTVDLKLIRGDMNGNVPIKCPVCWFRATLGGAKEGDE